jgi:hypothetical protein
MGREALSTSLFSGDISYDDFMEHYFHKRPCVLRRNSEYKDILKSSDIDRYFSTGPHKEFREMFYIKSEDILIEDLFTEALHDNKIMGFAPQLIAHKVREFFDNGGSVQIGSPHDIFPHIKKIKQEFEWLFNSYFSSTLFFEGSTPRDGDKHFDETDMFFFQTEGRKKWKITGSVAHNANYSMQQAVRSEYPGLKSDDDDDGEVFVDMIVEEGDVLYMPRGCSHIVDNIGSKSLHVAFTLTNINMVDFKLWQTNRGVVNPGLLRDVDLLNFSADLKVLNKCEAKLSTQDDIDAYIKYYQDNNYSNNSTGFIPDDSVAYDIEKMNNFKITFCPLYKARFEGGEGECIVHVNTESFELEDRLVPYYVKILDELHDRRIVNFVDLIIALHSDEFKDRDKIKEIMKSLYDFGVVNIN